MKKKYSKKLSKEVLVFWFQKNWPWLCFFVLSVAMPLIWLKEDFLYVPEEGFFANYQIIFDKYLYAWSDKLNYGAMAGPNNFSLLIPNAIFYKLFSFLGLSNHVIQIIYLEAFLFASFIAISYFLKIFTSDKRIIFFGSLIYILNFYFYQAISYSAKMSQIILMPLFFYWMYRYLESKDYKYAAYNFIGLFFLQNIFCNLPQLVVTFFAYPLAILYFFINYNFKIKKFLSEYGRKIALFFIILVPIVLLQGILYYFSMIENYNVVKKYSSFSALASPLHLIFQFRGIWWEYQTYKEISYNHWLPFYDNKIVIMATFALLLFPFAVLFMRRTLKKKHIFWMTFFLLSVFLASGTAISKYFFLLIFEKVPFFYIFREPWAKFIPLVIFSFSTLTVMALEKIKNKRPVLIILLALLLIKSLPFFSFNFFDHNNSGWKKLLIKTPEYWSEYFRWSKKNKDKYVLNLPFYRDNKGYEYIWYSSASGNANASMTAIFGLNNSVLEDFFSSVGNRFNEVAKSFDRQKSVDFVKLGTINYLLEEKDLHELPSETDNEYIYSVRKYFADKPEYSFGDKLFLYRIRPEFYLPHIYVPESAFVLNRSIDDIPRLVSSSDYGTRSSIFIKEQNQSNIENLDKIKNFQKRDSFSLNYKKINSTKYAVDIKSVHGIFPLIFLENYNKWWRVYLDTSDDNGSVFQTWFQKPVSDKNRLVANGYANGWLIDSKDLCANKGSCQKNTDGTHDLRLIIEFWPQRLFYLGFFFLGAAFFAAIIYLIYHKKRNILPRLFYCKAFDNTIKMSKLSKKTEKRTIIFMSNVDTGVGMSGGTTIYLYFLNHWGDTHKIFFGSLGTIRRLKQDNIHDTQYVESDNDDYCNLLTIFGIFRHTIRRLRKGLAIVRKNSQIILSADYIYSVSDFYPDFWPAFYAKLKNKKIKWIVGYYLFAPAPFSRRSPYKGIHRFRGFLYWLMQRPTYFIAKRFADIIFVTSEPDVKKFITKKRNRDEIVVVQGGVDITESEKYLRSENVIPLEKRKYDACFVGRFHFQKGVLELIDIWGEVCRKKNTAKLAMIGDGVLESEVKKKIKKYGLEKNIDLLGYKNGQDKYAIFKQSKMMLHPATYDSGGMAAAEGMAWGLPGVSFDLEALKTYYPKGMLKSEKNNLDDFSENILKLISDENLYSKTAEDAHNLILEVWDWKKRAEMVYKKITI